MKTLEEIADAIEAGTDTEQDKIDFTEFTAMHEKLIPRNARYGEFYWGDVWTRIPTQWRIQARRLYSQTT